MRLLSSTFPPLRRGTILLVALLSGLTVIGATSSFEGVVNAAHNHRVNAADFSPDSKWLLTAGEKGSIKLWDIRSRRLLREFDKEPFDIRSVAFLPDGEHFVSCGWDLKKTPGNIKLWSVDQSSPLRTVECGLSFNRVTPALGGKALFFNEQLIDLETGRLLKMFGSNSSYNHSILFEDAETVLVPSDPFEESPKLRAFNLHTANLVRERPLASSIADARRLPGTRLAVVLCTNAVHLVSVPKLAIEATYALEVPVSGHPLEELWCGEGIVVVRGKALRTDGNMENLVLQVTQHPDGRWGLVADRSLTTMHLRSIHLNLIAFDQGASKALAVGTYNSVSEISLHTIKGTPRRQRLGTPQPFFNFLDVSANGLSILISSGDALYTYGLNDATVETYTAFCGDGALRNAWFLDSTGRRSLVMTESPPSTNSTRPMLSLYQYTMVDGTRKLLKERFTEYDDAAFHLSSGILAYWLDAKHIRAEKLSNGQLVPLWTRKMDSDRSIFNMVFSRNGEKLTVSYQESAEILDAGTGARVASFDTTPDGDRLSFDGSAFLASGVKGLDRDKPDHEWLGDAIAEGTYKPGVWSVVVGDTRSRSLNETARVMKPFAFMHAATWLTDQLYVVGCHDGSLLLCDRAGKTLSSLNAGGSSIKFLRAVPGSRLFVAGNYDALHLIRFDQEKLEKFVTLVVSGARRDPDWVAFTPDGYFSCSSQPFDLVHGRFGRSVISLEQVAAIRNRPDVLIRRLGFGDSELASHFEALHRYRLKSLGIDPSAAANDFSPPSFSFVEHASPVGDGTVAIVWRAEDSAIPLTSFHISVNGVPVNSIKGKALVGGCLSTGSCARVQLTPGKNIIQGSVFNRAGIESNRDSLEVEWEPDAQELTKPPRMFVCALGVSEYRNKAYSLGYAAKDAQDLVRAFSGLATPQDPARSQISPNSNANVEKLLLTDQQITTLGDAAKDVQNLVRAFSELANPKGPARSQISPNSIANVETLLLTDQQVTPSALDAIRRFFSAADVGDIAVLFLAGHGIFTDQYYLLGHEFAPARISETALTFVGLEQAITDCQARRRFMFVDTCQSGDRTRPSLTNSNTPGLVALSERALGTNQLRGMVVAGCAPAEGRAVRTGKHFIANALQRRSGLTVFAASGGSEAALESSDIQNGLFTASLWECLSGAGDFDGNGYLDFAELTKFVTDSVQVLSGRRQMPEVVFQNVHSRFQLSLRAEWPLFFRESFLKVPTGWQKNNTQLQVAFSSAGLLLSNPQDGISLFEATLTRKPGDEYRIEQSFAPVRSIDVLDGHGFQWGWGGGAFGHTFIVFPNEGEFAYTAYGEGGEVTFRAGLTPHEAVSSDKNVLVAFQKDGKLRLFVNNHLVCEAPSAAWAGSNVGLWIRGKSVVRAGPLSLRVPELKPDQSRSDNTEVETMFRLASKGNPEAQFNMGNSCFAKQSYDEALMWFEKAANNGHNKAQNNAGSIYARGLAGQTNYFKAMGWFRKSAEQGNVMGMSDLAKLYYNGGFGLQQDYAEALKWHQTASDRGDARALFMLGVTYSLGHGVSPDEAKAEKYFIMASEKGHARAMYNLSILYNKRAGIGNNASLSREFLRKSAEGGCVNAQTKLGLCYLGGEHGFQNNRAEGTKWIEKAASQGDDAAKKIFTVLQLAGTSGTVNVNSDHKSLNEIAQ